MAHVLWDVATGKNTATRKAHADGVTLTFGADGRILASCGTDRTIKLWEVNRGKKTEN
jgi:WD40 repeat protein